MGLRSWEFQVSLPYISSVVSAVLFHLSLGSFYSWSNLLPYVASYIRHRGYDTSYSEMSWVIAVMGIVQSISMWLICPLLLKHFPRTWASFLGAASLPLASFLSGGSIYYGPIPFVLTYSLLTGLAFSAYTIAIYNLMEWMPKRKGLATGFCSSAFGAGAFLFDMLQTAYVNPHNVSPVQNGDDKYFDDEALLARVPGLFFLLGGVYLGLQTVGGLMMFVPDTRIATESLPLLKSPNVAFYQTRTFWIMWFTFYCIGAVMLFLADWIKVFGQHLGHLTDDDLALAMGLGSLCNGLGRLLWGCIVDATSFVLCASLITLGASIFVALLGLLKTPALFTLGTCLIFSCYSGAFSIMPAGVASVFGTHNLPQIYGSLFMAPSLAMLTGTLIAAALGSQFSALHLSWAVSAIAFVGFLINLVHLTENTALRRRAGKIEETAV